MTVRVLLGMSILALLLAPARARGDAPLTIEEAVRLSLANNESAQKAPLRVDAAQGQLERARAAFLPTLTAVGSGQLKATEDKAGRVFSAGGSITLNQPILNASAFPLYAQARHQLESERWGAVQDRRVVAFNAARAFLVVLQSERVLEAANSRLERARANQKNAEARAGAGLAGTNDATRAQLDTIAAARDVAGAQATLARAYLSLGFTIGKSVTGPLAAPDRTTRAAETGAFGAEDLARKAEEKRADVRSAAEKTAALREAAREPLFRLIPTLGLSAQMKLTVDPLPPERAHDETGQLTLTWNVYDAGQRYADRRTRLAQANSQALDERQLRRSIATDVGLTLATLKASRESYRLSEDAVVAAKKNTAETELLYQQGLARAIELVDANSRRFDAEVSRATAKLAMEQAYLELRFVRGLDPVDDEGDGASASRGKAQ